MKGSEPNKGREVGEPNFRFPLWYFLIMLMLLWGWQEAFSNLSVETIRYSEFKRHLAQGDITGVTISEYEVTGKIQQGRQSGGQAGVESTNAAPPGPAAEASPSADDGASETFLFRAMRVEDPELVALLEEAGVPYTGSRPSVLSQVLLAWVIPIALMVLLWMFILKRMAGGGNAMMAVGKSRARLLVDRNTGVRFDDVAGCDEAKFELQEVVDFLKNPGRYKQVGARIPKGVLLVGPPGTGKTMLARAVAGEAEVAFFSLSGSDFVEMFVGVGAARVRDLFQQAKGQAPCLVFIDELDAIGRQRGVHVGAVNDEREQTLNQLLVEMDGFEANTGVILLSATNRPDVLDRALLRPGRFDRQVVVDAPDLSGREAVLKVHARNKPLAPDVELRRVARSTPGFSGADLANAMNEAALLAARRGSLQISQDDIEEAVEKVVAGPERKSRRLNDDEKRRVAYHEVGHALVAAHSDHADPVHKISVVPRGRAALGYTLQLPAGQQFLLTKAELLDRLRSLLGGRAAEEITFGEISTGAENDLDRATVLARQMVCLYGMSDSIGLPHCARWPNQFLGDGVLQRDCSEETAREVDLDVKRLLDRAYSEAKELLTVYRHELDSVANVLLERESIDSPTFYRLIGKEMPRHREQVLPEPA